MYRNVTYTAAYAEMTRYILQGIEATQRRDTAVAIRSFEHASLLADRANLGPDALIGSHRNLASAYRVAGMLPQAEQVLRELLARTELTEEARPFVTHELGMLLAQAGAPEAVDALISALSLYPEREDVLLCGLDLAEYWLAKGELSRGYQFLLELIRPEDSREHPERFCHAQLTLARYALANRQTAQAQSHLETAHSTLAVGKEPILRTLYLAISAEQEHADGKTSAAQAHAIAALEQGLTDAEADTGEVLRSIASIFLKVFGQTVSQAGRD